MTQIHFTLDKDELQELISNSGANEASKLILTKLFNELMANQRDEYCKVDPYERDENRTAQRNGYYQRDLTTRIGTINLDVPRTRDGNFSTDIFERYQRNEKALVTTMLETYVSGVSTRKVGQVKAIQKSFTESVWQRCQVHFLRNVMDKLPKKNTQDIRQEIKELFRINDIDAARITKDKILEKHSEKYNTMCECLDQGFEDSFQYTSSKSTRYNRVKSTNLLERLNKEIRRREKVVRIFPNVESADRLIGSMLIDIDEDWITNTRRYIEFTQVTD